MIARVRRFGSDDWRSFVRFVLFGVVNALTTYALYLALLRVVSYAAAYTVSYVAGIFISYYLNSRFVFKERLDPVKALQYPLVYVAQYCLGITLLYVFVKVAHFDQRIAPVLVLVASIPLTYSLSKLLIKRRRKNAADPTR
ncbi:MAG: GtrA family protein [Verrucomicrobiota bacterium]|nr:GtrA family protein [Verrucomicrobiota bacterium]